MNDHLLSDLNVTALLSWFKKEAKAYPWGENTTPYRVWVSEIMLQQTVVTAVIPFFDRWMDRYPDHHILAASEEEEVLRYWEGLGYYSRGRNLLKAAKIVHDDLNGSLPVDYSGWTALPGVGDYTARAVLSIAKGHPLPVLDANVRRIGQRLGARIEWIKGDDGKLMTALDEVIPLDEPGLFNVAMMQLGQMICTTGMPRCGECPIRSDCEAEKKGIADQIPLKKKKKIIDLNTKRILFVSEGEYFLIQRKKGIGKGLWIFPGYSKTSNDNTELPWAAEGSMVPDDPRGIPAGAGSLCDELISKATNVHPLKKRTHNYTRYREILESDLVNLDKRSEKMGAIYTGDQWIGRWFSLGEIEALPVPSVYRNILNDVFAIR